jgi:aminomethyltransferase
MRQTPLFDEYVRHGAKVVDFHGWMLPVQFSGILQEHQHTRTAAGLFDCSHMGEFLLRGADAIAAFDRLVYSDIVGLKIGRCRYSAILNDHAGIIDDCVALRLSDDEVYLVTNAGPLEQVAALIEQHAPGTVNCSDETAKLDLQGPKSRDVLLEAGFDVVANLGYWTGARTAWRGADIIVTRAGYTGELGYELFVPNALAVELWRALTAYAAVAPCGLGARDTLRTEVGYPLNGEDADESRTPLEAGMDRFIAWNTEFPGKAALIAQRERDDHTVLTPLCSQTRQAPRHGFEIKHAGTTVGMVTSGTFGPSVGVGIGLGYVPKALATPGVRLTAGPRDLPLEVTEIPIYKHGTCRMKI